MAGFSDVLGQEHIKRHFKRAVELKKTGHAYIIEGESGTGKRMIARAAAMTLQCEKQNGSACGECLSCRQLLSGNQPDVRVVTHEKPNTISVEDVRDQLVSDIQTKPYSSTYKIYIIEDAEKMTVQAQNAILKTIEEPPAYGIIFLLTRNRESFLETILSRCITLQTRPLPRDVMKSWLMGHYKIPDYQADEAIAFSEGNIGKAMNLANGDEFTQMKENLLDILKKIPSLEDWETAALVKNIAEYKEQIGEYLDLMVLWFRDVLCVKSERDTDHVHFADEKRILTEQSQNISFLGIQKMFDLIEAERARLRANVNFEMGLELMLMGMHEAYINIEG